MKVIILLFLSLIIYGCSINNLTKRSKQEKSQFMPDSKEIYRNRFEITKF